MPSRSFRSPNSATEVAGGPKAPVEMGTHPRMMPPVPAGGRDHGLRQTRGKSSNKKEGLSSNPSEASTHVRPSRASSSERKPL